MVQCQAAEVSRTPLTEPVGAVLPDHDDELTFAGQWTDEVLQRSGAYFDVPAAAVRRRTRG
jgi:hypothetical protein